MLRKKDQFTLAAALALGGLTVLCTVALPLSAAAQDDPKDLHNLLKVRSSPFAPPTEDVFVTDDGAGLDTGCTFNTDPNHPLVIDVLIDRAVGEVDGNGHLVDAAALIADGVIPAQVEVIMPAFDVDINGSPPPENDEVLFNGESLGILTGDNQIWKLNSFSVDVRKLKFPVPPPPNSSPAPAANRVQVNVDILSRGRWCTAIDWVALVVPIKLKTAFKLEPTAGNDIRVRDYTSSDTIDVIYEQSFDADCNLTTDIDDYDEYPFSGQSRFFFGLIPGIATLHTTLETCPRNDHLTPEVTAEWKIAGTSLAGVATWSGYEGDVNLFMPGAVGAYDVELTFTVDGKTYPAINRKLFVTYRKPLAQVDPPRLGWYEKATDWASGEQQEGAILTSLLGGLRSFGQGNWRYIDSNACDWMALVEDPVTCDYANCYIFSDVFENMAATLGIGGLSAVRVTGAHNWLFLTNVTSSLDPAFPGNAQAVGNSTYDRYVFTSHSLRLKSQYYDATFNNTYSTETGFITANAIGISTTATDADGTYWVTDEGWNIYRRAGNSYATWGNYDYKAPTPLTPPKVLLASVLTKASGISFTGNVSFDLLDDNLDGLAEALTAEVEVRLDAAGQYTVIGFLQKGGQPIASRPAWESMLPAEVTLDEISGTYDVTLQLSGEQIYRSAQDGPYDLVLEAIAAGGSTSATFATPAYDHTAFGEIDARLTGATEAAVDADADGDLDFIEVTLDLDVRLAGDFRLQGALGKGGQSVADAASSLHLAAGAPQVVLRFEGASIRRSGLDGPYDGSVNLIDAGGHTIDSLTFTTGPYSAGSFSALLVPQGSFSAQGIDDNGNALYDVLRVDFGADVGQAGSYLVTGVLRAAASPSAVYADTPLTVPGGATTVRLEFPGPVINALELDGPYTVDVLVRDPATLRDLDAARLPGSTAAFSHTDFDPFGSSNLPIVLTGSSDDQGVDTDGNGLFDELYVDVEIALTRRDFYEWSARLVDANGTEIGFDTRRATLDPGITDIRFVFDGERIGNNGVDGPYFVKGLLIFGRSGANLVGIDVAETRPYSVTEFEGADIEPPEIVVAAEPTVLWPPNHKYQTLTVADFVVAVTDDRDPSVSLDDVVITGVTSDEPDDAEGEGDGATVDDMVIAQDCRSLSLRAERAGGGNGRVYTIHVAAADSSGNVGSADYSVIVPHDAGGGAVDDSPAHEVVGCAP